MERFIGIIIIFSYLFSVFKIQYGEIYSYLLSQCKIPTDTFKIQYGEIYSMDNHDLISVWFIFKIQYGEIYSWYTIIQIN